MNILLVLLTFWIVQPPQATSSDTLSLFSYLKQVSETHPEVKRAQAIIAFYEGRLLKARSAVEPTLNSRYDRKDFEEKPYYERFGTQLKVPTIYGPSLSVGYGVNTGTFINPQDATPNVGLVHLGLDVPLLQGLFTDPARTNLTQARILVDFGQQEQVQTLNRLFFDATQAYLQWLESHLLLDLANEGVKLSVARAHIVRRRVEQGVETAIDSTEANLEVQLRFITQNERRFQFTNMLGRVMQFIGFEQPQLPSLQPDTLLRLSSIHPELRLDSHPDVLQLMYRRDVLKADERLAIQKIMPQLDVSIKPLVAGDQVSRLTLSDESMTLGLNFKLPILQREGRGDLKMTRAELTQIEQRISLTRHIIYMQQLAIQEQLLELEKLIANTRQNIRMAAQLLSNEITLFDNGESTLFIVNRRERALLEAKESEIRALIRKEQLHLQLIQFMGVTFQELSNRILFADT